MDLLDNIDIFFVIKLIYSREVSSCFVFTYCLRELSSRIVYVNCHRVLSSCIVYVNCHRVLFS